MKKLRSLVALIALCTVALALPAAAQVDVPVCADCHDEVAAAIRGSGSPGVFQPLRRMMAYVFMR